ncbi:hypothetical protein [Croceivirga thetidis]|uniref:Lipoprotein n=1 Tax=Croceivirga thetidis TaxID=2721623 RepID=A0ABX1GMQ1_9FLAO|nr:hypothetical protein [Croceivirga thetidis]NKI31193.1 hypothetical protein [Croceivirga thetidis]
MRKYVVAVSLAFFVVILSGCTRESESEKMTTAISRALFDNAEVLYKSEINRTRVAFNNDTRLLIYHFWKAERFVENGTLFFHLYPEDPSNLPENRKELGFLNKNLSKEQFVTHDSVNYYLVLKMPEYNISKLTTGQFINGKRNWHVNEPLNESGLENTEIKSNSLSLNNHVKGIINSDLTNSNDKGLLNNFESLLELSYTDKYPSESDSSVVYTSKTGSSSAYISEGSLNDCGEEMQNAQKTKGMQDEFKFQNSAGCLLFLKKD